jgi:putative heme iron utilization protein
MSTKMTAESSARIRAALAQAPAKMALQMARDLGVPEVEIVRHPPAERATELDAGRWEELFGEFASLGRLHVIVSNGMTTLEAVGEFGNFSTWGEFFNCRRTHSTCTSASARSGRCLPSRSRAT